MKIGKIIVDVFSGGTPNTQTPEYWGGDIPWLSSGETRNRIITTTEKTITKLGVSESSTRLAKKHDIVIASAGQGTTRGRVSYCFIDTYINQSVIAVRCDKTQVEPIWLFYNLYNRYEELRRLSDSNASRGSITTKLIKDLDVCLPSLDEQRAISTLLTGIEERIVCNNKSNELLKSIGQLVFRSIFTEQGIVHAKAASSVPQESALAAMKLLSGKDPKQLPVNVAEKLCKFVGLFPEKFNTTDIPIGWQ